MAKIRMALAIYTKHRMRLHSVKEHPYLLNKFSGHSTKLLTPHLAYKRQFTNDVSLFRTSLIPNNYFNRQQPSTVKVRDELKTVPLRKIKVLIRKH